MLKNCSKLQKQVKVSLSLPKIRRNNYSNVYKVYNHSLQLACILKQSNWLMRYVCAKKS